MLSSVVILQKVSFQEIESLCNQVGGKIFEAENVEEISAFPSKGDNNHRRIIIHHFKKYFEKNFEATLLNKYVFFFNQKVVVKIFVLYLNKVQKNIYQFICKVMFISTYSFLG
jgi:hypothetical protein